MLHLAMGWMIQPWLSEYVSSLALVVHRTNSVVAVHGIGANPDKTWETQGGNWLRDSYMLPQAIPKSRIMRFGYGSLWFGASPVKQRMSALAQNLLVALFRSRKVRKYFDTDHIIADNDMNRVCREDLWCSLDIALEALLSKRSVAPP